ncbi:Uncharacterised protein [BD1-7 clade bacterium]|uniref:HTH luxR-type domain-containing protein n=1 Tax=BD1-7 clade bacterium TaxID=2029982 RepID=A0A5S9QGH5_9GAMM|nr:Uncharacterised protein [BD1-7 clade bacterium]CAA0117717.1 Uncharacterised protein [BD1-7 clade bacterium]
MNQQAISDAVANMISCLSFDANGLPDWQRLVHCCAKKNGADFGRIMHRSISPSIDLCTGKGSEHNHVFDYSHGEFHLQLCFDDSVAFEKAKQTFQVLDVHLRNVLDLALKQHANQWQLSLFADGVSGLDIGIVIFTQAGDCEWMNDIARELLLSEPTCTNLYDVGSLANRSALKASVEALGDRQNPVQDRWQVGDVSVRCSVSRAPDVQRFHAISREVYVLAVTQEMPISESPLLDKVLNTSPAQTRVLRLSATGMSADDVASATGYTKSTVYSYIKAGYKRFNVNKQAQLTAKLCADLPV